MSTRFDNNFYRRDSVAVAPQTKYVLEKKINPSIKDLING